METANRNDTIRLGGVEFPRHVDGKPLVLMRAYDTVYVPDRELRGMSLLAASGAYFNGAVEDIEALELHHAREGTTCPISIVSGEVR